MPSHYFSLLVTMLDGLLAGMFICSSMVEHGARKLGADAWIAYKHTKEEVFGPVMPALFNFALLATAASAFFSRSPLLVGIAAALLALVMGITIVVHLPLNKLFVSWAPTEYPVVWDAARRRWRNWNLVRTVPVVAAYGLVLIAQS